MKKLFFIILFFSIFFSASANIDSLKPSLKVPEAKRYTESLFTTAGKYLDEPFTVFVIDSNKNPIPSAPVLFELISHPENEHKTKIEKSLSFTDSTGKAETNIKLGETEGTYIFSARIKDYYGDASQVYLTVVAREKSWVLLLVSGMIGGLGLFLFGMYMLSEGLKKAAGSKMRNILNKATNNRFVAVGIGTLITIIVQSSSATTVMLVSFVQANLLTFVQTLGVILGAGIGTTITLQLIAFKITDFALLIIGLGFILYFFTKSKKIKSIGEAVLGFGILFYGMHIMSSAMVPLRTFPLFLDILLQLENPILGILVGTLITALIQSSAVSLGLVLILGMQGLITLEAAIPLIFGANIGTSVTAILASINSNRDAKRVAFAHTLFKVIAVLIFLWFIPSLAEFVRLISPTIDSIDIISDSEFAYIPRQIANAHTVFNLLSTLIFLPFLTPISKLINKLLPDKPEEEISPYETKFLEDSLITTPSLALNLAKAEVLNFAKKVKTMTEMIIIPFFEDKPEILDEIKEMEKEIDFVQYKTAKYLTKISQQDLDESTAEESFQLLQCSAEFELIADLISSRLRMLAKKRIKYNLNFSQEGKAELSKFHLQTVKQVARAIDVFKETKFERGKKLERKYQKYKAGELDLKRAHFKRLRQDIPEAIQTNEMHLELIDLFLRINRHAATIGRVMMGAVEPENGNEPDPDEN